MSGPHSFTCSCGASFNQPTDQTPPDWEWRGGQLLCPDCIRIAAFSFALPAPTSHLPAAMPVILSFQVTIGGAA